MVRGSEQRVGIVEEDRGYDTPCHIWQGFISPEGYAKSRRKVDGVEYQQMHRWSYVQHVGPIPDDRPHIDHLCRVRCCINPDHLEPVTHQENVRRGDGGKFWTEREFCKNGHRWSDGDYWISKTNTRLCIPCRKDYLARKKEKNAITS